MRKIVPTVFAVLLFGILLNCTSVSKQTPEMSNKDYQIRREWMLVVFGSYSKPDLVKNNARINLTSKIEDGKIKGGAFMGCNNMFFTSEFNKGKVKISDIGSTRKACPDMKLESEFSKSFKNMTQYSVEGHFLTLSDDDGNQMKFVAADWD